MLQFHLFISGSVQGVGFRYFAKTTAEKIGIKGWVRNLYDGRVESVVQGNKESIEYLIQKYKNGPFLAEVKDIIIKEEKAVQKLERFEIRETA